MKTVLRNSGFSLAMVACVGLFISAAWLWHRSLELGDFIYRTRPSPAGNTWRGVGSYHGAMLFGSLVDPTDARPAGYHHDAYPLTKESLVRIMPSYKARCGGIWCYERRDGIGPAVRISAATAQLSRYLCAVLLRDAPEHTVANRDRAAIPTFAKRH